MIKIVITGPESTGKTSIAGHFGIKFNIPVVDEFAVEYLRNTSGRYNYRDLLKIALGQVHNEETILKLKTPQYVICDTDLITIKIWSVIRFKKVHKQILSLIESRYYDHYILCSPDIDWEYSEFRENPDDREFLFRIYEEELIRYGKTYHVLTGKGEERINNAGIIFGKIFSENIKT
jgi:nicotinamide riboside kinase